MLLTVTPAAGTNCVTPDPISIKLHLYPTGIEIEEFKGIVKFIVDDVDSKIVLLISRGSKINPDVLVITVLLFSNCGSRSNLESTEFQLMPSPARSGYPPVAPLTALVIDVVTNACVARFAVFGIPWTFVVAELCVVIAVFLFVVSTAIAAFLATTSAASAAVLFTTSAASASTRV